MQTSSSRNYSASNCARGGRVARFIVIALAACIVLLVGFAVTSNIIVDRRLGALNIKHVSDSSGSVLTPEMIRPLLGDLNLVTQEQLEQSVAASLSDAAKQLGSGSAATADLSQLSAAIDQQRRQHDEVINRLIANETALRELALKAQSQGGTGVTPEQLAEMTRLANSLERQISDLTQIAERAKNSVLKKGVQVKDGIELAFQGSERREGVLVATYTITSLDCNCEIAIQSNSTTALGFGPKTGGTTVTGRSLDDFSFSTETERSGLLKWNAIKGQRYIFYVNYKLPGNGPDQLAAANYSVWKLNEQGKWDNSIIPFSSLDP